MRELILKEILKLFSDRGIAKTTIDDIANECGISHGLIYHYFESKNEIIEVLNAVNLAKIVEDFGFFGKDISGSYKPIIEQTLFILTKYQDYWRFSFDVMLNNSWFSSSFNCIAETIDKPYQSVWFNYFSNVNIAHPELASLAVMSYIHGEMFNYLYKGQAIDPKNFVTFITNWK